jgi:phage recombination protein Bet
MARTKKPLDVAMEVINQEKEKEKMESKEMVIKNNHSESIVWSSDQVQLIKDTICKGATDNELKLFLHVSQKTGLDPFVRQIYSIGRWDGKLQREVHQTMVSIDGARLVAERSGKYKGQLGPFWCGTDGQWREVWLEKNPPAAAKVGIIREDFNEPLWGVATWNQYAQTNKSGQLTPMWSKMAPVMLAKCAEMLGLRKAFPQDLSGLYEASEMDQASNGMEDPKAPPKAKEKPEDVEAEAVKKPTEEDKQIAVVLELSGKATKGMSKEEKSSFIKQFWGVEKHPEIVRKSLGELKDIAKNIQAEIDRMNAEPEINFDDIPWGEE